MPKLMYKDKEYSGSSATTAKQLDYNNTDSNLDATNAQDAIDEIKEIVDGKAEEVHKHKVSDISDLTATATELNYMDGVTSGVQGQINTLNDKIVSNTNEISALNSDLELSSINYCIGELIRVSPAKCGIIIPIDCYILKTHNYELVSVGINGVINDLPYESINKYPNGILIIFSDLTYENYVQSSYLCLAAIRFTKK